MTAPNPELQLQEAEGLVLAAAYATARRHAPLDHVCACALCDAVARHRKALEAWAESTSDTRVRCRR